ncbi:hypothetical protein A5893_04510 [Pedobacter psychrophilus]|uniref:HNH endonuclease 5 domain-containing protein n=1 Tax=Pedobacter psychrophilus TaxID=1826909 RepID=A0A179DMW1_9SPHI|nr:hypothetical protein [Pedobacter psychrophilus]OAQ42377.1 hypothetical protein A5893_04510 [Pedobacter psychrophilus]
MRQIKIFSDYRLDLICSYCSNNATETRDHVPSKILLDEPFPENLPVVPCCTKCNQDFSKDEEYFACSIECILRGSSNIEKLQRQKIKMSFQKRPALQKQIENSFIFQNGILTFKYKQERFENVATKLAKGHVKFETSNPQFIEPTSIVFKSLSSMTEVETDSFFSLSQLNILPEVGSRALQNLIIDGNGIIQSNWKTAQDNKYKYSVINDVELLIVRIVVWNYLAIEVIWNDN